VRPDQPSGSREREWKWEIPSAARLGELRWAAPREGVRGGAWATQRLANCYYDTVRAELRARGAAFRVRSKQGVPGELVLTLKEGHQRLGAFHQMLELQSKVACFDPHRPWRCDASAVERLLELVGRQPLVPLVRFQTERSVRLLQGVDGGRALLALDRVRWADGEYFLELELELAPGTAAEPWRAWILALAARCELRPSERTKLARALARAGNAA